MTAPATPTPLDVLAGWATEADGTSREGDAKSALAVTRRLVEAALTLDAYRVEGDGAGWPDWDSRFDALEAAAAAYRNRRPATAPDAGEGE